MGSTLSVVASVAILRSSFNEFVPQELRTYLWDFSRRFSSELAMVVEQSHEGSTNDLFNALVTYLGSNAFSASTIPQRLAVGKNESMKQLTFGLDKNSEIVDTFHGVKMRWAYYSDYNSALHYELRWYELRFHKQHTDMVKNKYLPYIIDLAKRIKDQNRVVKFYTTRGGRDGWSSKGINLDHPMTFETLAMDGELKQVVIEDLNNFIRGKEYYRKIGKIWKRGYLLYGPPGTGKSSLIAAMANYLNFDIYNLNLAAVNSDSSLEYLLLHMSNRSILVVEDIDCSIMLHNRQSAEHHQLDQNITVRPPQVTLSGLLNAIDGLLSCCGDERIVVFTTNYKDRIDPALLRAGRMDMHVYLSYCTFSTFKQLAANYLDIWDHDLFSPIEKLIGQVQVTPAEVAGELMKTKDPKASLEALITFLENKANDQSDQQHGNDSKDGHQFQSSSKSTFDPADKVSAAKEEKSPAVVASPSMKVSEYTIKAELAPILEAVLTKYGDICANSSSKSIQFRSSFLEIACGIIQKLQITALKDLTELELKSMLSSVHDLESLNVEVSWLHHRLDEILQAIPLIEHCAVSREEKRQDVQETTECCSGKSNSVR
ncbi:hypothetical protein Tsubulata_032332 [Turnera subulata]|uniref:AAA+ ATPase domain-containing protein n=1 Tax=Turnera subulata TaxID=218843 RepID=A0A9Q0FTN9_9ROSI|nr:hypothetical protein Tsubulata_032332 [Turnera subulata]